MELGWGGFDRAKLDMIRIPFSFHAHTVPLNGGLLSSIA